MKLVDQEKEPTEIKTRKVRNPTEMPVRKDEKEQKMETKKKKNHFFEEQNQSLIVKPS